MLRLLPFRYIAPRTLDEAARLLADYGERAMPVAGGTDLYPNMKRRQFTPERLVGLRGLRDLRGIAGDLVRGITIGALTTLTEVRSYQVAYTPRRRSSHPKKLYGSLLTLGSPRPCLWSNRPSLVRAS